MVSNLMKQVFLPCELTQSRFEGLFVNKAGYEVLASQVGMPEV